MQGVGEGEHAANSLCPGPTGKAGVESVLGELPLELSLMPRSKNVKSIGTSGSYAKVDLTLRTVIEGGIGLGGKDQLGSMGLRHSG